MPASPFSEFFQPPWFFLTFALMWAAASALLAVLSGWTRLARTFRATQRPEGRRFWFVSGSVGRGLLPVSYRSCLSVSVGDTGFGLSVLFPFRLFSPPLFIPWTAVERVDAKRLLFVQRTVVRLKDGAPTIAVHGRAGEAILAAQARAGRGR